VISPACSGGAIELGADRVADRVGQDAIDRRHLASDAKTRFVLPWTIEGEST
jgi:hypothetical protein